MTPAGVSHVQTMLLFGSGASLDKFQKGSKAGSLVLGTDFKVTAVSDLGLGSTENAGNLSSADAVSLSLADGLMVDWSVVGMSRVALTASLWPTPGCCLNWPYCA